MDGTRRRVDGTGRAMEVINARFTGLRWLETDAHRDERDAVPDVRARERNHTMIRPTMLLAALLAFTPMALADDGARSQRGQAGQTQAQGGLTGVIQETLPAPVVAPVTPVEALPVESLPPTEAPVVESPIIAPTPIQKQQANERANTLPALGEDQLPPMQVDLGQTEPLVSGNQTGELGGGEVPIIELPAQGGVTEQQTTTRAEPAKKPGFFKRMWTKVKGFFSNIKSKLTRKKAPTAQEGEVQIQDEPSLAPGGEGPGAAPVG